MEIGGPDSATINGFSNSISNGFGFIVPHMGLYMRRVTGSWMPHLCVTTIVHPFLCREHFLFLERKSSRISSADYFGVQDIRCGAEGADGCLLHEMRIRHLR